MKLNKLILHTLYKRFPHRRVGMAENRGRRWMMGGSDFSAKPFAYFLAIEKVGRALRSKTPHGYGKM